MPSGEAFTNEQLSDIERVIALATSETSLAFSVFVGNVDGDIRDAAEAKHAAFGPAAAHTVLMVISPGDRMLEIVTGEAAARRLTDRACALAALSMTTSFEGGDLAGGIITGIRMLAEAAGHPIQVR
ncbi:MAG TPA: DUF5130 family protein [Mycobacteriales bacterium]|nr:DUF5130 family protein [Mycobacteriales bacterium]